MSWQYRTTTLFHLCFISALAASFYGNASLVGFVVVQSLCGAYVGSRQRIANEAVWPALIASLTFTFLVGLVVQLHSYLEAIALNRTSGYPIFEDGVVMELLVMLPTLFLIYGSIGAVVAILSSLVGQHIREFAINTVRY